MKRAQTRFIRKAALTAAAVLLLAGCGVPELRQYQQPEAFRNYLTLTLGEQAPDFRLKDIEGGVWRLSDHRGKLVVLQFASATSPAFVQSLDHFRREVLSSFTPNRDVQFVYVFTTEAHPELLSEETQQAIKRDPYEHRLRVAGQYYYRLQFEAGDEYDLSGLIPAAENVVLLVDDPEGSVGDLYGYGRGGTTNPTFVIDKNGVLLGKGRAATDFLSASGFLAGNLPMLIQSRLRQ
jgi:hypothetical protein